MRDTLIVLGFVAWIYSMLAGVNQRWLLRVIGSAMLGVGIFFAQIIATVGGILIAAAVLAAIWLVVRMIRHALGFGIPRRPYNRPPYDPFSDPFAPDADFRDRYDPRDPWH